MPEDNLSVGGLSDRGTIVNLNAYWRDKRYDYIGGDLVYMGVHFMPNIATSDAEWEIWKFTYGADGIDRIQGPITGAWDDRAALTWS